MSDQAQGHSSSPNEAQASDAVWEQYREKYANILGDMVGEGDESPASLEELIRRAGYDPSETTVEEIESLLQALEKSKESGDEIFFSLEMPGGEGKTFKL